MAGRRRAAPRAPKRVKPSPTEWSVPADVWIDLSAPVLDIPAINRALRLKATHWYTPERIWPRSFEIARATALPGEACCWQYRTGLRPGTLPNAGVDRLVRALAPRADAIRSLCRSLNIEPEVNVWFEHIPGAGPYAWLSASAIRLCASIGARVVISTE